MERKERGRSDDRQRRNEKMRDRGREIQGE